MKLTARDLAVGLTSSWIIHVVNPADATQDPAGSSYKAPISSLPFYANGGNTFGANAIIGTNDAFPFIFETNNIEAARFTTAQRFGIGTTTPNNKIQVAGLINFNDTLFNTGLGSSALLSITTGQNNTAVGYHALRSATDAFGNTAVGYSALTSVTNTATYNTAVGHNALTTVTTASGNTAFGSQALAINTAANNTAVGYGALSSNSNATGNVAVGYNALTSTETGGTNTAVGFEAGYTNVTGTGSVFIGYHAGRLETASNKLYISNSNTATPLIGGDFSTGYVNLFGNVGIKTSVFGTSAAGVLAIKNGTAPSTAPADTIQIFSVDSDNNTATLGLFLEQAVEAIGTFTASHKIKIKLNGTLYWVQLDSVSA